MLADSALPPKARAHDKVKTHKAGASSQAKLQCAHEAECRCLRSKHCYPAWFATPGARWPHGHGTAAASGTLGLGLRVQGTVPAGRQHRSNTSPPAQPGPRPPDMPEPPARSMKRPKATVPLLDGDAAPVAASPARGRTLPTMPRAWAIVRTARSHGLLRNARPCLQAVLAMPCWISHPCCAWGSQKSQGASPRCACLHTAAFTTDAIHGHLGRAHVAVDQLAEGGHPVPKGDAHSSGKGAAQQRECGRHRAPARQEPAPHGQPV